MGKLVQGLRGFYTPTPRKRTVNSYTRELLEREKKKKRERPRRAARAGDGHERERGQKRVVNKNKTLRTVPARWPAAGGMGGGLGRAAAIGA